MLSFDCLLCRNWLADSIKLIREDLIFISNFRLKYDFISPLFWWVLCAFICLFFNLEWKAWQWTYSACRKIHLQHKERNSFGWSFEEWNVGEKRLSWFLIFTKPSLFCLILSCFCMCFFFFFFFCFFLCVEKRET